MSTLICSRSQNNCHCVELGPLLLLRVRIDVPVEDVAFAEHTRIALRPKLALGLLLQLHLPRPVRRTARQVVQTVRVLAEFVHLFGWTFAESQHPVLCVASCGVFSTYPAERN